MSDISSMNRENKKRQLKRQVVTPQNANGRREFREENHEAIAHEKRKRWRKRRLLITSVVVAILCMAAFATYQYIRYYEYAEYETVWELPMQDGNFVRYMKFGAHMLKYTKDGASHIDAKGKDVWVQSYEMKTPIGTTNGDYAAIADQQGNRIYIFDKNGSQGVATTLLPITRITISAQGVVAAVLEDSKASYITLFKKDGSQLDITIKSQLAGDGYPLDISLSPDGTQLLCSYMYMDSGMMKCRVVFYNFSEIGKNIPTRLAAGYDEEFSSSMVPKVQFLSETYSCAFADDKITFFSSKNLASPELIKSYPIEEEAQSIFYSDKYVGVILNHIQGENPYQMDIYKADGSKVFSKEFNYPYQTAEVDGDFIMLYNENSCRIYNMSGVLKFSSELDFNISKMTKGKLPSNWILTGPQIMKEIKLK